MVLDKEHERRDRPLVPNRVQLSDLVRGVELCSLEIYFNTFMS